MDERTFATLEVGPLLDLLTRHVQTEMGRRKARDLRPSANRAQIEVALDFTSECVSYLASGARFGLAGIEDPEPALARLHVEGTVLTPQDILLLERLLSVGSGLKETFKNPELLEQFPRLAALASGIPDVRMLLSTMRGKILPGGEIDDGASPELRALRREIAGARSRIYRTLESILRGQARAVQDEIITFRNGRFVIPVRTDSRSLVPGVVHGLSSSGQTTFIEPLSAIEQNNDLVRLHEEEEAEISRILFAITEALRAHIDSIRAALAVIEEIDFAQAKAKLSEEFGCVRPVLASDKTLLLRDARHIILENGLRSRGEGIVPITVDLDGAHQVLVVSGPNAGGKTVVVKTVGLIAIMAQMGLHVPAREAVLPIFDRILADIGDQQSISANLSTFTAHMRNIAQMTEQLTPQALILLDEVGTGTDPDEGAALAVAIVDFFRHSGAATVATTHYAGLKMWASQTAGVRNASVEFDERTLMPTYRLILGIAGASSGLEIARRMNIPSHVLDHANSLIEPGHAQAREYLNRLKAAIDEQDAKLLSLDREREMLEHEHKALEESYARREAERGARFDEAMEAVIREFTAEGDKMIQSVRNRIERERLKSAAAGRAAELRRIGERLRRETERGAGSISGGHPAAPHRRGAESEIREGDLVHVESLNREGTVESAKDRTFTVAIGPLKFRTEKSDLRLVNSAGGHGPPAPSGHAPSSGIDLDQSLPAEVKVIGMTADEATDRVDKFLDEAFLAGAEAVRIIHGHGKGILRRAIAELLSGHPHVEKYAQAPPNQGGGGVTVVELRK